MKRVLITFLVVAATAGTIATSVQAARLIGANPDLLLTIAQRQHLKKLKRQGKIKSIYAGHANRLEAAELDKWNNLRRTRSTPTNNK